MYQLSHEAKRTKRITKLYEIMFGLVAIINVISFLTKEEYIQGMMSALLFSLVFWFVKRKKEWAKFTLKVVVWVHVGLLGLIIVVSLVQLMR
ncbi:hypothetical protein [Metabacillus iocasae]|uniref:Cytochrome c oxidase subunit IV n=1 Tax=Priestia iocasae TaxID=2291674 RepID=A0ABS2QTL1_9BACI|nr:hypothetical protein [Metabacillus iocasae]MBM7702808.1 cytochrome c oxidase subunit IV [Metabacillus iocasae]